MNILFINGSPNKAGKTAALAAELLNGKNYETMNLTDYTIGSYDQQLPSDGLDADCTLCFRVPHRLYMVGDCAVCFVEI